MGDHPLLNAEAAAAAVNPRKCLSLVTWNIGSLHRQRDFLFQLLVSVAPQIVFLQECHASHGSINALRADVRSLGYCVHTCPTHGLLSVVQHGLNVAPISSPVEDEDFRVQRFAWQISSSRVLVRHRHAHSNSAAERRRFNELLAGEPCGDLWLDIGGVLMNALHL